MPRYQLPFRPRHESGQRLADLTVTTTNAAGEEVLTGSVTARVGQQIGQHKGEGP
jgi:hypothetical protein